MDASEKYTQSFLGVRRDTAVENAVGEQATPCPPRDAIGQLVPGIVHEGRNALQQIQACCWLLQWRLNCGASQHELFADLQRAEDRLAHLFDKLEGIAAGPNRRGRSGGVSEVTSARMEQRA